MKYLFSVILFASLSINAIADIPRMDIVKFDYDGQTYYTGIILSNYNLKEGCLFSHKDEYLGEEEDMLRLAFDGVDVRAFSKMLKLPKSVLSWKANEMDGDYYSDQLLILRGDEVFIPKTEVREMKYVSWYKGNPAGGIASPMLTEYDLTWIMDYPLERIASLYDNEMCDMDLFAIKGNISKSEAHGIKTDLLNYYKRSRDEAYKGKTDHEIYADLLERHIFMIGFCSC